MSNHQSDISDFQMGEIIAHNETADKQIDGRHRMDFEFTNVYEPSLYDSHLRFLYTMLKERPKCCFISHKVLPPFSKHVQFVGSSPYKDWQIIRLWEENPIQGMETGEGDGYDLVPVGNIYLTHSNELGIFILKKYQGRGIARAALKAFMALHKGPFLANINPANEGSIKLFTEKLGFKHIQNTYRSK